MKKAMRFCAAMLISLAAVAFGQAPNYDGLIQVGKAQLQAGHPDQALATGEQVIKLDTKNWEGYALAGGALMNLKRYDEAISRFSDAMERAPQDKQAGLNELRRQCFVAESGGPPAGAAPPSPAANSPAPEPTTTQAEIVLWKSIENSSNANDFQAYLSQYPKGAFAALANQHLQIAHQQVEQQAAQAARNLQEAKTLVGTVWDGDLDELLDDGSKNASGFVLFIFTSPNEVAYFASIYGVNLLFRPLTSKKDIQNMESAALSLPFNEFADKYRAKYMMTGTLSISSTNIALTFKGGNNTCSTSFSGTRTTDTMQMAFLENDPTCNKLHGTLQLHRVGNPAVEAIPGATPGGNQSAITPPTSTSPLVASVSLTAVQSTASSPAAISPAAELRGPAVPSETVQVVSPPSSTLAQASTSESTTIAAATMPLTPAPTANAAPSGTATPSITAAAPPTTAAAQGPGYSETVGVTIAMLPDPPKSSTVPPAQSSGPTFDQTIHWMSETAPQNPLPEVKARTTPNQVDGLATYILPGSTCSKTVFTVVHYYGRYVDKDQTEWFVVDLGGLDPAAIVSVGPAVVFGSSDVVAIFNTKAASVTKDYRDGKALKATTPANAKFKFGTSEYALRFANALKHAVEVCGGQSATPPAVQPF